MFNSKAAIALSAVVLFATPQTVSAQGKLNYSQAFAKCKQELDAAGIPKTDASGVARASAGGACMQKYGFRLKKKAKI